jgi:hypothetical protein
LVNIAIADAGIAIWQSKYFHMFWRPITAIRLASSDNNPDTAQDDTWTPFLGTPPYPDYPSGFCGLHAAGFAVLADYFGETSSFSLVSDSAAMLGVVRHYSSFGAAERDFEDARVFSGIHFRFADEDATELGHKIAEYILANACLPLHGKKTGQLGKP